jgi:hypothetical protein
MEHLTPLCDRAALARRKAVGVGAGCVGGGVGVAGCIGGGLVWRLVVLSDCGVGHVISWQWFLVPAVLGDNVVICIT